MAIFGLKKWLSIVLVFAILAVAGTVYFLTKEFEDTNKVKASYVMNAGQVFTEFEKNDTAANKKYTEKVLEITGIISALEKVDSTYNVKMTDSVSGSFLNFSFQRGELEGQKVLAVGQSVTIRGSCSGSIFSEILETHAINFKRCVISQ